MGVVQKPGRSGPAILVAIAVLAAVWYGLHYYRPWPSGPGTHDLTDMQRKAALASAFRRGEIAALRESGEMVTLGKRDVAGVGKSRCIGEHECYRTVSARRGPDRCGEVHAVLTCAYELVDKAGEPVLGILRTFRGGSQIALPDPSPDAPEWTYDHMQTERPDAKTAGEKACQMGYCGTSFARWRPPPPPADPYAESRRRCEGVLADVAGRGATCLDPTDPRNREFRDCKEGVCGPVMVAVPTGRYTRGTTDSGMEALRKAFPDIPQLGKDEQPAHEVTIGYHLAVGKLEITFDDWEACTRDIRCTSAPAPSDQGWGRGRRPVIGISWEDITRSYLPWLNARLGLSGPYAYRLPTDAEWEYAARAGTTTLYAFGDAGTPSDAVYRAPGAEAGSAKTAETGSLKPNAFGLHDMHGNVAELVEDCINFMIGPSDLPRDGSARETDFFGKKEGCGDRGHRGGSYASGPDGIRSASRGTMKASDRNAATGFRVVRTLWRPPS